jgi:excisionase family DNA binding protein
LDKGATSTDFGGILTRPVPQAAPQKSIVKNARPMPPKFINKRQVAQLFGVSKSTIERWLQDGKLPKPKRRFGWARWRYEELAALLKNKIKS